MWQDELFEEFIHLEHIQYCETVSSDDYRIEKNLVCSEENAAAKSSTVSIKNDNQSFSTSCNMGRKFSRRMNSQGSTFDSDTEFEWSQKSDSKSEFDDEISDGKFTSESSFLTPSKSDNDCSGSSGFWSPTANLKLLLKAASPDIRNRELELKMQAESNSKCTLSEKAVTQLLTNRAFVNDDEDSVDYVENLEGSNENKIERSRRKEKSLSLLCQRFLSKYPEYPEAEHPVEISLDDIASHLGVGRRRVYDIMNVLESVSYVSRFAKNKYLWYGRSILPETLSKLKALALQEGLYDKVKDMVECQISPCTEQVNMDKDEEFSYKENCEPLSTSTPVVLARKSEDGVKKSLYFLSQRFIMLFLVAEEKALGLDLLAKTLVNCETADTLDTGKYKTTLRRLYDIANILSSLRLIGKKLIHLSDRSRKPAFVYIGPQVSVDENFPPALISQTGKASAVAVKRPASRSSAAGVKRSLNKNLTVDYIGNISESSTGASDNNKSKYSESHSSLPQISCEPVNVDNQMKNSATGLNGREGVRNLFLRTRSDSAIVFRPSLPSFNPVMGANQQGLQSGMQGLLMFRMQPVVATERALMQNESMLIRNQNERVKVGYEMNSPAAGFNMNQNGANQLPMNDNVSGFVTADKLSLINGMKLNQVRPDYFVNSENSVVKDGVNTVKRNVGLELGKPLGKPDVVCRPLATSNLANIITLSQNNSFFQKPGNRIFVLRRLNSKDN